jgi:hypothetical protein
MSPPAGNIRQGVYWERTMNRITLSNIRGMGLLVASLLTVTLVAPPVFAAADDITGTWEMTMDFGGRPSFAQVSIARGADGGLTGKWGGNDLAEVKFADSKLTFVRTIRMPGDQAQEFKLKYEGTLKDGKIEGKLIGDQGEFAANGARVKARPAILGQWDLAYKIQDRDIKAVLSVTQKPDGALDAKWTSNIGEHVVSDVKFADGKLTFSRKTKINDMEIESTFEGTATGNTLAGKMKSQMGEIDIPGQRVGGSLIGKWALTSTSEQGTFTQNLTVFPDMTARYQFFDGEIPVKDLKLDNNQVTFTIEMGFGDQTFEMKFKGTLAGKDLNGEFDTSNGKIKATAKKIEAGGTAVGTWELTSTTQQGTRTSTLTIKDDMTGTYKSRDTETPIKDLKVEGDQISFKVVREFQGNSVTMEFKGKIEGTTLNGQFISERGNREVTGKKI